MPACHFDDAHIKMMLRKGFDFEDARGTVITQQVFRDVTPTHYMSLFVDSCIQTGKDVTAGGAVLY